MGIGRFGGGNGTAWITGATAPLANVGSNGDFYLNTSTGELYGPKTAGAWGGVVLTMGPGPTGPQGPIGPAGPAGAGVTTVQPDFMGATRPAYFDAGGSRYIPLLAGEDDTVSLQLGVPVTGTLSVYVKYAMSSASAGNVELYLDRRVTPDGGNPMSTLTAGTEFTVTPGANTSLHTVDQASSASFSFAVVEGDLVYLKLGRTSDVEDTNTADMHIYRIFIEVSS